MMPPKIGANPRREETQTMRSQWLVPIPAQLCPRSPLVITPRQLVPTDHTIAVRGDCPVCGWGNNGRFAVAQVLPVDDEATEVPAQVEVPMDDREVA
jgi:hypothetical protein